MRCLDSGTALTDRALMRPPRPGRDPEAGCGNCGRWVKVTRPGPARTARYVEHGDRRPCPLCDSRSPRHHPTDHPEA